MADKSIIHPRGIVEDVLVKVSNLVFLVDVVILDSQDVTDIPLNLGRPFLNISRSLINMEKGKTNFQSRRE